MAENLSQDEHMDLFRCTNEDPLKEEEFADRLFLLMHIVNGKDIIESLYDFVIDLKKIGLREAVSLFPEREFNVLNVVEYLLHYIVFTVNDWYDFIFRKNGTSFSTIMEDLKATLSELKKHLKSESLLDEEQALRVDTYYEMIADAHQFCNKSRMEDVCPDSSPEASAPWLPFLKENFATKSERFFVTRLREISINSHGSVDRKLFKGLVDILESADLNTVLSSDVLTNTVMCMVKRSILNVMDHSENIGLSAGFQATFIQNFSELNSVFLHSSPPVGLRRLAETRITDLRKLLESSDFEWKGPELLDCKTLGSPSSVLWEKLSDPEAAAKYADPDVFTECAICGKDDVRQTNFAILDICDHLFCVDCISQCFFEFLCGECPYCRQEIYEFTTRDFFLSKVKEQSSSEAETEKAS